jgi:GAF domain-containing protein
MAATEPTSGACSSKQTATPDSPPAEPGSDENVQWDDPIHALTADFVAMAHSLFAAGSVEDTLAQVAGLAVATIEGCDFASVLIVPPHVVAGPSPVDPVARPRAADSVVGSGGTDALAGRMAVDSVARPRATDPAVAGNLPFSPTVATDVFAAELDALQRRGGQGPGLDAMAGAATFYAEDLADDHRWPLFGPEAAARGVRSLLSLPLVGENPVGALNLYAQYPQAFGVIDRARGLLLAAVAGLALASARTHEDDERRSVNLQAALATRELVGQAQGILMERERITADQAFDILRRASQHLNRRLREVAQTLIETGERPDTGRPPSL